MTKYLTVKVEQKHIRRGRRGMATSCPIALAMLDTLGRDCNASVGELFAWWDDDLDTHRAILSKSAVRFVDLFDHKGKKAVEPTTFRLEIRKERS